jgi:glycosyltransferase involved in cell wall biosynthesis
MGYNRAEPGPCGEEQGTVRLLYTIPSLGQGGAERQLSYLAGAMTELGHTVEVAFLRSGVHRDRLGDFGVRMHDIGPLEDCEVALRRDPGNYHPKLVGRLVSLMNRIRPDIAQSCLTQMDVITGIAAKLTRRAWVLRESSFGGGSSASPKLWIRRLLARNASGVIANSRAGAASWMRWVPRPAVTYIPNGIPYAEIAAAAPADASGYGFGNRGPLVVYAGRFVSCKNISTLLAAAAAVVRRRPDVRFLLAGEGPERARAMEEVSRAGLESRIVFAGFVASPWQLMKSADLLVSVSRFEGAPNTVLEAMAAGCPLVVSDIPAHREILDESMARFADPGSPAPISAAIENVLGQPEEARRRALRARDAVQTYSVEAMARRYDAVYRAVHEARQ